jgi:hypothetical protein
MKLVEVVRTITTSDETALIEAVAASNRNVNTLPSPGALSTTTSPSIKRA